MSRRRREDNAYDYLIQATKDIYEIKQRSIFREIARLFGEKKRIRKEGLNEKERKRFNLLVQLAMQTRPKNRSEPGMADYRAALELLLKRGDEEAERLLRKGTKGCGPKLAGTKRPLSCAPSRQGAQAPERRSKGAGRSKKDDEEEDDDDADIEGPLKKKKKLKTSCQGPPDREVKALVNFDVVLSQLQQQQLQRQLQQLQQQLQQLLHLQQQLLLAHPQPNLQPQPLPPVFSAHQGLTPVAMPPLPQQMRFAEHLPPQPQGDAVPEMDEALLSVLYSAC